MATGYTYGVVEGKVTQLKDFAMKCGAAFFYDCHSVPGPIKVDPHYQQSLKRAKAELNKLTSLRTKAKQSAFGKKMIEKSVAGNEDGLAACKEKRARLEAMQEKVLAWKCPKALQNLKSFMLSQLEDTIKHECNESYYEEAMKSNLERTPLQVYKDYVEMHRRDVRYYEDELARQKREAHQTNKWIAALHKAFGVKPTKKKK